MIPRVIAGALGILGLVGLTIWSAAPSTAIAPALVVPAQTYEVSHAGDGAVRWRLLDGTLPGGPLAVADGVVLTERGGTVDIEAPDDVAPGPVSQGTVLLVARRPDQEAIADARGAESAAADAEATALANGARPALVSAALARVQVARAALARAEATEFRATAAANQGALPELEAELARLDVRVQQANLHAARQEVESARLLPWEAEQAAADARAAAAASWAEAADARAHGPTLSAPFDGVLQVPGGNVLARLEALDSGWLQVRVPERSRSAWSVGAAVSFTSTDGTFSASGRVTNVGTQAQAAGSIPVVWATVRLDAAAPAGSTGVARTAVAGWWP